MTTPAALARERAHGRFRLTVVVVSVIAAAVGSVVLATRGSQERTTTHGITSTLRVPGHPRAVAAGAEVLWVGLDGNRPLLRLDLATGDVVKTVHVGGEVSSLVRDGERLIASVTPSGGRDRGRRRLVALDWRSGRALPLGTSHLSDTDAREIDLPFDQVVRSGDSFWALESRPGRLLELDRSTLTPSAAPLRLSSGRVLGLAAGEGYVWATATEAGDVLRIDPASGAVTRAHVGGSPVGIAVARGEVWFADRARGSLVRLDARSLRPIGDPVQVGAEPSWLAPAGDSLFVTDAAAGTVARVDARSGRQLGLPIRVGDSADGAAGVPDLTSSGDAVWMSSFGSNTLTRITARSPLEAASGEITVRGTGNGPVNPGPEGNGVTDGGVASTGRFAITGAIEDHGTYVAYRKVTGQTAKVKTVLAGRKGTITMVSTIHLGVESRAPWAITSATRSHAGLHGRGTLTVDNYQADPYTFVFAGTVSR